MAAILVGNDWRLEVPERICRASQIISDMIEDGDNEVPIPIGTKRQAVAALNCFYREQELIKLINQFNAQRRRDDYETMIKEIASVYRQYLVQRNDVTC